MMLSIIFQQLRYLVEPVGLLSYPGPSPNHPIDRKQNIPAINIQTTPLEYFCCGNIAIEHRFHHIVPLIGRDRNRRIFNVRNWNSLWFTRSDHAMEHHTREKSICSSGRVKYCTGFVDTFTEWLAIRRNDVSYCLYPWYRDTDLLADFRKILSRAQTTCPDPRAYFSCSSLGSSTVPVGFSWYRWYIIKFSNPKSLRKGPAAMTLYWPTGRTPSSPNTWRASWLKFTQ